MEEWETGCHRGCAKAAVHSLNQKSTGSRLVCPHRWCEVHLLVSVSSTVTHFVDEIWVSAQNNSKCRSFHEVTILICHEISCRFAWMMLCVPSCFNKQGRGDWIIKVDQLILSEGGYGLQPWPLCDWTGGQCLRLLFMVSFQHSLTSLWANICWVKWWGGVNWRW